MADIVLGKIFFQEREAHADVVLPVLGVARADVAHYGRGLGAVWGEGWGLEGADAG